MYGDIRRLGRNFTSLKPDKRHLLRYNLPVNEIQNFLRLLEDFKVCGRRLNLTAAPIYLL
jgi:hypothetical protein